MTVQWMLAASGSARDDTAAISDQVHQRCTANNPNYALGNSTDETDFWGGYTHKAPVCPCLWIGVTQLWPVVDSTGSGIEQPAIPSVSCQQSFQFIRHTTDATYIQQRDKTLQCALQKWRFLIMLDPQASDVGSQLVGKDEQETELVLTSVMGVKSPNTVLKRANALLLYYRWNSVNGHFPNGAFQ